MIKSACSTDTIGILDEPASIYDCTYVYQHIGILTNASEII